MHPGTYGRLHSEVSEEAKAWMTAQLESYRTWQLNAAGLGRVVYLIAGIVFFMVVFYEQYSRRQARLSKLPPGPFLWPSLGCLPRLAMQGRNLSLRAKIETLAQEHGPLMFLHIADSQFVVVSSGEAAKEVLIAHDAEFSYRPRCAAGKYLGFGSTDMAFATGKHHRLVRHVCGGRVFAPARLAGCAPAHKAEATKMVHSVWAAAQRGDDVAIRETVTVLVRNSLCRMLLGTAHLDVADISIQFTAATLMSLADEALALAGEVTLADLTPGLRWLDLGRRTRKLEGLHRRLVKYFQVVIDERRRCRLVEDSQGGDAADVVDVLLSLGGAERLPDKAIMGILVDTLLGGTYTTSSTVEWALAELVRHPAMLEKVQNEIDDVVGPYRMVEESDLPELPYFQAVVKETLRLHPAMPLSLPHMNVVAAPLANYEVPAMTSVVINYAAIGRDPATWPSPLHFRPARFVGANVATHIDAFELLPFGYGRRGCPGANLGLILVQLALASLVQGFEWKPVKGQTPHDIDVAETSGAVCFKANPLVLSATPRFSHTLYKL